ncbi:MAG: glycosyltransferase family 2 protein, partial [Myxococcales bacterium]|nr:glycosyltransferase family 2 protein [Myxococcales bacterium]
MKSDVLVSCIMPTFNRRQFIPRALRCFLAQTYPNRELIVLDDGDDPVADLMPAGDPRVRYVRLPARTCVGKKRNMACKEARGDLIAHFDDDDWYAPERLALQVEALRDDRFDLCGVDRLLYYDLGEERAYEYRAPGPDPIWLSLLCYRRSLWAQKPFPEVQVASDTLFLQRIAGSRKLALTREGLSVCTIHGKNVSPKRVSAREWRTISTDVLRQTMGDDFGSLLQPELPSATPPSHPEITAAEPTSTSFSVNVLTRRQGASGTGALIEAVRRAHPRVLATPRWDRAADVLFSVPAADLTPELASRAVAYVAATHLDPTLRAVLSEAAVVVAHSPSVARWLEHRVGRPADRVISPGPRPDIRPRDRVAERFTIVVHGHDRGPVPTGAEDEDGRPLIGQALCGTDRVLEIARGLDPRGVLFRLEPAHQRSPLA